MKEAVVPTQKNPGARVTEKPPSTYVVGRKGAVSLVAACVRGEGAGPMALIESLQAGFPFSELETLRDLLDLPMDRLAAHLSISRATLHRRKTAGRLDSGESDRVLRFARLLGLALTTMESLEAARGWLATPQIGLGGAAPLVFAETEVGAREVEDLLTRIEFSVYA
jgi:putative toxin-antitoxin system antitoxin component (TIGR02293 family)